MAKQRDYAKEYAARKTRGQKQGYTLSQIRGHAKKTELPISVLSIKPSDKINKEGKKQASKLLDRFYKSPSGSQEDKVEAVNRFKRFRETGEKHDFVDFISILNEGIGRTDDIKSIREGFKS